MLCELSVQVMWAPIFMLLEFCLLKNVRKFFSDQVFLLFVKYVDSFFNVIEPWMVEDLFCSESFGDVLLEHVLHEITRELGNCITILYLLLVQFVS